MIPTDFDMLRAAIQSMRRRSQREALVDGADYDGR
jgi:hypothetical protein